MSKLSSIPLRQRDQFVIVFSIGTLVSLAWAYLIFLDINMGDMSDRLPGIHFWTFLDFGMMFLMWVIMMVAMMVPSAMRTILIYAQIAGKAEPQAPLIIRTYLFVLGYVIIWALFSVAATALQWGLDTAAMLSPMMVTTSSSLGAALLIAAGIYQLTPLKDSCLKHCQSPIMFLASHYQKGRNGALKLGLTHGIYCLGCCWILMGLLFVGGVMNLIWIFAISLFVLGEKLVPPRVQSTRITSVIMMLAGSIYLVAPYLT